MLRLYMDEDSMDQALVSGLRARGVDVLTAQDAAMIARSDAEHLAFATSLGRVLCTHNVSDFWQLHRERLSDGLDHAGIVLMAQQRLSLGDQLRRLLSIVTTQTPESMHCRAEFLSNWKPAG